LLIVFVIELRYVFLNKNKLLPLVHCPYPIHNIHKEPQLFWIVILRI